jgi:hypothetical protein
MAQRPSTRHSQVCAVTQGGARADPHRSVHSRGMLGVLLLLAAQHAPVDVTWSPGWMRRRRQQHSRLKEKMRLTCRVREAAHGKHLWRPSLDHIACTRGAAHGAGTCMTRARAAWEAWARVTRARGSRHADPHRCQDLLGIGWAGPLLLRPRRQHRCTPPSAQCMKGRRLAMAQPAARTPHHKPHAQPSARGASRTFLTSSCYPCRRGRRTTLLTPARAAAQTRAPKRPTFGAARARGSKTSHGRHTRACQVTLVMRAWPVRGPHIPMLLAVLCACARADALA